MTGAPAPCGGCQALVIWAVTPAGERMPVDAAPSPDGTLVLIRRPGGEPPLARVVKQALRFGRKDLYLSHFATCPDAAQFRRPRPQPRVHDFWLIAKAPSKGQPWPCRCNSSFGCRQAQPWHKPDHCHCWNRDDLDHLPLSCCARRRAAATSPIPSEVECPF